MSADNRFIIIGPARTGSTMLRTMLNNIPSVTCHGELYALKRTLGVSPKVGIDLEPEALFQLRVDDEASFYEKINFLHSKYVGLKAIYFQLFSPTGINFLRKIQQEKSIKIIHIWREDLIARHFSEVSLNYKARHRNNIDKQIEIEHLCDPTIMLNEAATLINWGNFIVEAFGKERVHNIIYEDFIESTHKQGKLLDFLNIKLEERNYFKVPNKRISFDNEKVKVNFINKDIAVRKFSDGLKNLPERLFL